MRLQQFLQAERRGRTWKNSASFSKRVKDFRTGIATRHDVFEMLEFECTLITGEAMYTQRPAAQMIISEGGHYVLMPKANQRALHKDAKECLEYPECQC